MKVTEKDNGYKALLARAKKLGAGAPFVEVGILATEGDAAKGDGLTLFDVAEAHEFGFGVPERSFIRAFFDATEAEAKQMLAKLAADGLTKTDPDASLNRLGIWLVAKCQARIRAHIDPPNHPMTVRLKGSSTPLIDTGQLWTSISYRTPAGEHRPTPNNGRASSAKPEGEGPKGAGHSSPAAPKAAKAGRDAKGRFLPKAPKAPAKAGRDEKGRFLPRKK